MANHSWVYLKDKLTPEQADDHLIAAVLRRLGDRLVIQRRQDWEQVNTLQAGMWRVYVPGSALEDRAAARRMLAPNNEYGFTVWLNRDGERLEFRHQINIWERWAQGVVMHDLCQVVGTVWGSDNDDELRSGDPDQFKASFREYCCQGDPLPEEGQEWMAEVLEHAPVGFRD